MDNDKLLKFTSRFVIIVPIIVVVLALIFKPMQKDYKKEIIKITPTISNNNLNLKKIDLNREYTCSFKTKDATQAAYIKNKKIFIESISNLKKETNYFLLSGDCIYNWTKDEYSGEKICGISSYISTAEKLLSTGLIDINSITQGFKQTGSILGKENKDIDLKDLDCKEQFTQKDSIFDIPLNILFKNKEAK